MEIENDDIKVACNFQKGAQGDKAQQDQSRFLVTPVAILVLLLRDLLISTSSDQIIAQAALFVSFFGLLLPITMSG